jgi:hypothetical protein
MSEKKMFSCKKCGEPFAAYSPDDTYVFASIEEKDGSIRRVYKCPRGHENKMYWRKQSNN